MAAFDGRNRETRIRKPLFTNFHIGASTPDSAALAPTRAVLVRKSRRAMARPEVIPLAFRHFQDGFRQSQALDLDLGNCGVDVAKVVCGDLDINRSEILFEAVQLRRARDRNDPRLCASSHASAI